MTTRKDGHITASATFRLKSNPFEPLERRGEDSGHKKKHGYAALVTAGLVGENWLCSTYNGGNQS